MTTTNNPGVYKLSIGPRTTYYGQAQNLRVRKNGHLSYLRRGIHHSSRLQQEFDKHGESSVSFEILLICEVDELTRYEQHFLDKHHGTPECANVDKVAVAPPRGVTRSPEHCARVSETHRGVPKSPEHRAKISAAKLGIPRPAEVAEACRTKNRANHPNIHVEWSDGTVGIWPSIKSLSIHLGFKGYSGAVGGWIEKTRHIPTRHNIASITRTDLPATVNPEA